MNSLGSLDQPNPGQPIESEPGIDAGHRGMSGSSLSPTGGGEKP